MKKASERLDCFSGALAEAKFFADRLKKFGFSCYVVGGCLRDLELGLTVGDIDLTTNASPDKIAYVFSDFECDLTGSPYGTVVVIKDGKRFEITTFRKENFYFNHRKPKTVEFCEDLLTDLSRRDFTCNAVAFSFDSGLIDPFDGFTDLKNCVLRAVGDSNLKIEQDALRILRALRFYSLYNLAPETGLKNAIINNRASLKFLSKERVGQEFEKIICGKFASKVVFDYFGVLTEVFCVNCSEIFCKQVAYELCNRFNRAPNDYIIRLALFIGILRYSCGLCGIKDLEIRLNLTKSERESFQALMSIEKSLYAYFGFNGFDEKSLIASQTENCLPNELQNADFNKIIYFLKLQIRKNGNKKVEYFLKYFNAKLAENSGAAVFLNNLKSAYSEILNCCGAFELSQLAVNGNDLNASGIFGKTVGKVLNALLDEVLFFGLKNEKNALLARANEIKNG